MDWSQGIPLRAGDMFLGLYQPSPETTGFWEGVKRKQLLLKYSPSTGRYYHPRRILCPDTGADDLIWKPASGNGKVYSFSEIHRSTGAFAAAVPYVVGIVELEEDVYLFTRIVARDNRNIRIDAPVKVDFRVLEQGHLLPVFVLQGEPQ